MTAKLLKNKTINSALWYTISSVIAKGITIMLTPLFTRILSVTEYGKYTNFVSWQNILIVIFSLELSSTVLRARFDYKDDSEFSSFVCTIATFGLLFSVGLCILLATVTGFKLDKIFDLTNNYVIILFCVTIFSPILQIFQAEQRAQVKYKISSVITILYGVMSFVLPYMMTYIFENKLFALLIGICLNASLWGIGIYYYFIKRAKSILKKEYIKYALIIAIPIIPHMISSIIMGNSDKIMINDMCGAEYAALYGVVYTFALVINLIRNSLNNAWVPWFYNNIEKGNTEKVKSISRYYLILFSVISLFIVLFGPEAIWILGGSTYSDAASLLPIIMLGCYYNFLNLFYVNLEFYYKKTYMISVITVFTAILNVTLNYICIYHYGYEAAAYTTAFCNFIIVLFHYFATKKMNNSEVCNNRQIIYYSIISFFVTLSVRYLYNFVLLRWSCGLIILLWMCFYVNRKKDIIKSRL